MSKETELSDEQLDKMQEARNADYHSGKMTDTRSYMRSIIAADRELRRGDASMPVAAWRYRTNNTHTHLIAIEPPSDAYDAGTLAPLVLLTDAQAALAVQAVEIEGLRRDAERYRWLRSDDIEVLPGQHEISVIKQRLPFTEAPDELLIESALDTCIDAAIAKEKS